jgi:ABC-type nitrate/sulfonate/bicarbonate transport system substrate-binding protein
MLAATLLSAGCDRATQAPLQIAIQPIPGYEALFLAEQQGYLADANLKLIDFTAADALKQALREGRVQVATLTLEDALLLRQDIPDLKIMLLLAMNAQRDAKQLNVLVMRDTAVGSYHRELGQLLQAWRRGLDYLNKDPDQAAQILGQHEYGTAALPVLEFAQWHNLDVADNQRLMLGEPPPIGDEITNRQRMMLNRGMIRVGVDPAMLLDGTLLSGMQAK